MDCIKQWQADKRELAVLKRYFENKVMSPKTWIDICEKENVYPDVVFTAAAGKKFGKVEAYLMPNHQFALAIKKQQTPSLTYKHVDYRLVSTTKGMLSFLWSTISHEAERVIEYINIFGLEEYQSLFTDETSYYIIVKNSFELPYYRVCDFEDGYRIYLSCKEVCKLCKDLNSKDDRRDYEVIVFNDFSKCFSKRV